MPRHLLTRRDSNELRFKITRLPSEDSFINSFSLDRSTSSLLDTFNLSDENGTVRLCPPSPTTVTTNIKIPQSSTHLTPISPSKQNTTGMASGAQNQNTNSDVIKMSTNTVTVSSSYGVLGVKKNFLHRAFQRNFSPGKVYREQESKSLVSCSDTTSNSVENSSPGKITSLSMTDQPQNRKDDEIFISPGYNRFALTNMENSPKKIISRSITISSTDNKTLSKSPIRTSSPLKKVSLLKFGPTENHYRKETCNFDPSCRKNIANQFKDNTENTIPGDKIVQYTVNNSPRSKMKLNPSPRKFNSKQTITQFPNISSPRKVDTLSQYSKISSPRKLDFPSFPINRHVNNSSQEFIKDSAIFKTGYPWALESSNSEIHAINQDRPQVVVPHEMNVLEQTDTQHQSSQDVIVSEKDNGAGYHLTEIPPENGHSTTSKNKLTHQTPNQSTETSLKTIAAISESKPPTASEIIKGVDKSQPQTIIISDIKDYTTAATTTTVADTNNEHADDKTEKMNNMAFPYLYPYQFFYTQGLAVPTLSPNPHPHHIPHPYPHINPFPLTPSTNLVRPNDSGYHTPSIDLSNNRSRPGTGSINSTSNSSLSMISNGALPLVTSPTSGGYLPNLTTTPSAPSPMLGPHLQAPFLTSTPYYANSHPAYNMNLLQNGTGANETPDNTHKFQVTTPPGPMMNHAAMMNHMAYLASLPGYPRPHPHPYSMSYPPPSTAAFTQPAQQTIPLDLSSSECTSPPKPARKKLFHGKNGKKTTRRGHKNDNLKKSNKKQKQEEDRRNPFGIMKLLDMESSPVKTDMPIEEGYSQSSLIPVSPAKGQKTKRRLRNSLTSSSNEENNEHVPADQAPKKKKSRDRPPLWGHEMTETIVTFMDVPQKRIFCDAQGKYKVPEIPENHQEQLNMIDALLTLFENSNLPPVPVSLRSNLFGLRFYPQMKTYFQASLYRDSRTIITSYGGLAFENFRAIDDNSIIDTMLKKDGKIYRCLTKKCIDPLGAQCSFTATSLGKMRRHVKNHLPDKKWVCAFCRTQMTDQTDMARHGTTHTLLRPFPCELCGKVFSQKVTLTNHIQKTHNITTIKEISKDRYTCRQCGVHFRCDQREDCMDHLKKYHFDKEFQSLKKRKRFPFRLSTDCRSRV